ncbi:hypothetical protein PSCFBP3800_01884 [Pseudomonas syringae group genomosp. 3]|uniref:Uncharacterized protein n=1 Tax=Pseudomonas syringae group genomosp. 3 TaxID=251701 RepID=A0A2K4WAQ0_9PSED|nr:hypothetical protein CFBP6411_01610 [Pseudomonas syringae group genomosp. 3]SPF11925.1 hypothetical protein PSCFBP3800_01884 [Pseudomonas syringae group genomosp. 3]
MQMWRTPELYFAQMSIPVLLDFRSPPAKNLYLSGLLSLPVSEFGICLTRPRMQLLLLSLLSWLLFS